MKIPPIYPITDRELSGLSHAEQVAQLASGGATFIQLREKFLSSGAFYREALAAVETARGAGVTVIINDRVDIALATGADGVHLGQTDIAPFEARRLLGPKAVIGFSTHSIEQAAEAVNEPIDYLAFGPIFPTSTKQDPDPVVGLDQLRQIRQMAGDLPVVAIGGITETTLSSCLAAGADSLAMISAVVRGEIAANIRRLINQVKHL